jgi:hypothetical protein
MGIWSKWGVDDVHMLEAWDDRITILEEFPAFRNIPASTTSSRIDFAHQFSAILS